MPKQTVLGEKVLNEMWEYENAVSSDCQLGCFTISGMKNPMDLLFNECL